MACAIITCAVTTHPITSKTTRSSAPTPDPFLRRASTDMSSLAERALQVHETLIEFYGEPTWRNPLPPVDELVSTILSQNTNDINRDRAFNALRARFPAWEAVR